MAVARQVSREEDEVEREIERGQIGREKERGKVRWREGTGHGEDDDNNQNNGGQQQDKQFDVREIP